jgi:hypothetical protein
MEIELPNGTVLDAPDGSDPSVVAKNYLAKNPIKAPAPAPEGGAGRQVALAGRAVGEGVLGSMAGLAEQFGKIVTGGNVVDSALLRYTGKNRMQRDIEQFNSQFGTRIPEAANLPELLHSLVTKAGAPEPVTSGEKLASAGLGGASSALALGGGSGAANAIRAGISGATGALSSETVKQAGGGQGAQFAAGLVGGLAPTALETGARALSAVVARAWSPLTVSGQEQIASNIMGSQATDAKAAATNLDTAQPIIPNSPRTTGEASRDVGLLALEKGVRAKNPAEFGTVFSQQNSARQAELSSLAGTPADIASAQAARDAATGPMRRAAIGNAPAAPVEQVHQTIDDILSSPVGKRDSVATALTWAKEKIGDTSDPASLYEIRKDLQLAQRGKYQPSSPNAPNASTLRTASGQLGDVISSLDDAIESVAPGFKAYLQRYKEMSRPIDQMKVVQEVQRRAELTSADITTGQNFLGSASFSRAMDTAIQKNGAKLDPQQIEKLNAIRADMQAGQAINSPLLKAPGSDTFQNMSIAQVLGAGVTDAHPIFRVLTKPLQWIYKAAGSDAKVNDLLANAFLDPAMGSRLLKQATTQNVQAFSNALRARFAAAGIGAGLSATQPLPTANRSTSPESQPAASTGKSLPQ